MVNNLNKNTWGFATFSIKNNSFDDWIPFLILINNTLWIYDYYYYLTQMVKDWFYSIMNRVFFLFCFIFFLFCVISRIFSFFFPFTLLSSDLIMFGICKVFDCEYKKRHELHIWIFRFHFHFHCFFAYAFFSIQPNNIEHNESLRLFSCSKCIKHNFDRI